MEGVIQFGFLAALTMAALAFSREIALEKSLFSGPCGLFSTPRYEIRWHYGIKAREKTIMQKGDYLIGRLPEAHIILDHETISHMHAVLKVRKNAIWMMDLGSLNGVEVDGERLIAWRYKCLKDGAAIKIGSEVGGVVLKLKKHRLL